MYDTVTQDCRPLRCNYSEASRAIWTSSLQVTGQVDMAIFWPHQQRTHRRPSIGHTDRNAEKFEIKPTKHQPLGEDARVRVSQKSRLRLINGLITGQSQSSQEYNFAHVSTKALNKTNIKSQMRRDKSSLSRICLFELLGDCSSKGRKSPQPKIRPLISFNNYSKTHYESQPRTATQLYSLRYSSFSNW